ncbi:hypothetical protein MKW92_013937 [Papaver armeniacum]|nr:hypothetical protein MKW92_013937 [Papaver armeniacum]
MKAITSGESKDDVLEETLKELKHWFQTIQRNKLYLVKGVLQVLGENSAAVEPCPVYTVTFSWVLIYSSLTMCFFWLTLSQQLESHFLLSGDANAWRHVLQVPEPHKRGVTCISGIMICQTVAIFASTSSDGSVYVWEMVLPLSALEIIAPDSLSVGSKSMVALSLAVLPGASEHILIAMGFVHACELKGHMDWIRCLDFSLSICIDGEKDSLLLLSSSQDKCIHLWKLALHQSPANTDIPHRNTGISLMSYIEGPVLGSKTYQISLESLLIGHEDWVYSVEWKPPASSSSKGDDVSPSLSIPCALGFYGGHWSPSGNSILSHGYGGSFHHWKNVGVDFDNWQPQKVLSGHFAAVTDVAWGRSGEYILSVSQDQASYSWHETAHPQVHGHDINCVTIIPGKGNYRFVSGADEKVARVFEEDISEFGANMSALGLSRKPIYLQARGEGPEKPCNDSMDNIEAIPDAVPSVFTEPQLRNNSHFTHYGQSHTHTSFMGMEMSCSHCARKWLLFIHKFAASVVSSLLLNIKSPGCTILRDCFSTWFTISL